MGEPQCRWPYSGRQAVRPTSKSGILGVFMSAGLGLSCSLVDLRHSTETDCTSQPATFCTRLNDSQPPSDACQSWTCNKATRFCELGPRDLDSDGAIDPDCAPSGGTHPLDCDDNDPKRFPDNPEVCDFLDNDCNNLTDENVYTVFDELTNDPNSFIPDTCPAGAGSCYGGVVEGNPLPGSGKLVSAGLAFASHSEPNDPQVIATFIRPIDELTENDNYGLLGTALFNAETWDFLDAADLDPEYQGVDIVRETMFDKLRALFVSVTPLQNFFAIASTGTKTNGGNIAVDGIIAFEIPPKVYIEGSELSDPNPIAGSLALASMDEQALLVRTNTPSSVPVLQLVYPNLSGSGCTTDAPCLTNGDKNSEYLPSTNQVPAVVGVDEAFGWLVAIAGDDELVIHRVQADETHALSISASSLLDSDALPDEMLSNVVLAVGPTQDESYQLALAYIVNDSRVVVHLLTLDTSTGSTTLSIAHTLDLSSMPGGTHTLPQVVWHPLRNEWVLGFLETSESPERLFMIRFTQDGTLLDEEAIQVFESRNLQPEISFHFKPIAQGFAVLGYQQSGQANEARGNLIGSKFGCSGP